MDMSGKPNFTEPYRMKTKVLYSNRLIDEKLYVSQVTLVGIQPQVHKSVAKFLWVKSL